jgi:hypothetical protein
MSLTAAFAALALSTAPVPQADTLADLRPEDRADVQCMAIITMLVGAATDELSRTKLTAGVFFYYGRLQGRTPQTDWVQRLLTYIQTEPMAELEANRTRCGREMQEMGRAMTAAAR